MHYLFALAATLFLAVGNRSFFQPRVLWGLFCSLLDPSPSLGPFSHMHVQLSGVFQCSRILSALCHANLVTHCALHSFPKFGKFELCLPVPWLKTSPYSELGHSQDLPRLSPLSGVPHPTACWPMYENYYVLYFAWFSSCSKGVG